MIKVSDYVAKKLAELGIERVFMVVGGGAMHLNDSIGRCSGIEYTCSHHEQASAIGAEGYARACGRPAAVVVTTGPGGTNALTGVLGQWLDSVPAIYVSGQVKRETTIESCREIGLRQLGDQEINIVDIVRPVTKFAAVVGEPLEIRRLLEKAFLLATSGRPGPVWLDIPLDVQGALVDEGELEGYEPDGEKTPTGMEALQRQVGDTVELLMRAERPVFVAGHGIRIAGAQPDFLALVPELGIPVVTTFCGFDLLASESDWFAGRIGTVGDRAGNFALQNADTLLTVGSRNNIRQVSYGWASYARAATKITVDVDPAELRKPTVRPDVPICADAGLFLRELRRALVGVGLPSWRSWLDWCRERKARYPVVESGRPAPPNGLDPYRFVRKLTRSLPDDAVMVAGNGTACVVLFQAGTVKQGQRIFWNSGCASMGYDLPAAIGACFANRGRDVICLAGDGSLQMNVQELQTVSYHRLPIKLFVLNNDGYSSIRQTQDAFFEGRHVGCDRTSGLGMPDYVSLARAQGIPAQSIEGEADLDTGIRSVLATPGPVLCEVRLLRDYKFEPKLSSERKPDGRIVSKPLEDMYPFLDREELRANMWIPLMDEE